VPILRGFVKKCVLAYTGTVIQHENTSMKRHLTRFVFLLIANVGLSSLVFAQSDVYLCVDPSGKKEYKNTGSTKGCKLVDLPRMNTVPSPVAAKKVAPKVASTPASFPKVDEGTQRSRDSDRKQILIDELAAEEKKLAAIKKEFNGGEVARRADETQPGPYIERVNNLKNDVARSEKNIETLKREISNLK
jgi:hypothetical protein